MLPWWGWVLLWSVLVLGGAALIWVLVRRSWASFRGLTAEIGRASALVAAVEDESARPNATTPDRPTVDVFRDPAEVARERHAVRSSLTSAKQARREARLPGWARTVDWRGPE